MRIWRGSSQGELRWCVLRPREFWRCVLACLELMHGTAWEWRPGMRVDPHSSLLWWVAVGKVQPLLIGLNVPDKAEPSWATPRLCLLLKGRCTPSVGIAPVLIGCSAS